MDNLSLFADDTPVRRTVFAAPAGLPGARPAPITAAGRLEVACDGSSLGNPGPGGWAWVAADGRSRHGGAPRATNNEMELVALVDALERLAGTALVVYCDSRYVIDATTKWIHGWRRNNWRTKNRQPVANRALIERAAALLDDGDVDLRWVKGHATHALNNAADRAARGSAERYRSAR